MTETRFTPTTFATQLARLNAEADAILRAAGEDNLCHTTQSDGYPYKYTPIATHSDTDGMYELYADDTDVSDDRSWLPTASDLGLTWTSRLRRHRAIDPMDETEALDAYPEFIGIHIDA